MKTDKRNTKKGSVLVVDDEEIMREVLETLLTAEGYRVDLAKTGEEGLEAYGRRAFDVVLLDVSMPGIGGLRALEEFLKMDSDAVIVMITAYATFDTAIAAWERGAFGCIRKPFQNEQIIAQMNKARPHNYLYYRLSRTTPGQLVQNERLPSLPPSEMAVRDSRRWKEGASKLSDAELFEKRIPLDGVVNGSAELTIKIE